MNTFTRSTKVQKNKKELNDDSGLSKNNGKNVKYRLRQQQDKESIEEIKEYGKDSQRPDRVF